VVVETTCNPSTCDATTLSLPITDAKTKSGGIRTRITQTRQEHHLLTGIEGLAGSLKIYII
jgi:hypothetical protein